MIGPHSLMRVQSPAENSPLVFITCCCKWTTAALVPSVAQQQYEQHIRDVGAVLGPVPWRKPPE